MNHPKFINIDVLPARHIHYIQKVENLSFIKSESVDLIYSSHCLEHFSHLQVPLVLAEWFRVLKKGGILRLSVPDFDLLLDIYQKHNNDIQMILSPLMGGQDYQYNFHMCAFTKSSLAELFKQAGFKEVRSWQPGTSELTTFDDWSGKKIQIHEKWYPVSLNLEAIK